LVFMRYVVHVAFMFVVWGRRDPASLWRTRRPVYQLARSSLMLVMPASFLFGIQRGVDERTIMAIFWLSPLLILALAGALLRERASLPVWTAALLASAGARLALGSGPMPPLPLLVLPVAMAASFGVYVVMTRSLRTETTRANLFYTAFGVVVLLAPFVPRIWITPTVTELLLMIVVGVLGFAGLYALDRATEAAPVAASAPLLYVQVPLMALAMRLTGQGSIGKRVFVGTIVIGLAGAYLWNRGRQDGVEVLSPAG
ncbi:MAG TPA: hypothetical protein VH044_09960, partial [Polyangiaceae bacterium]|nr:hypothetical protein [Polyangiaceae bacterium]